MYKESFLVMTELEFMIFDACVSEMQRLCSENRPISDDFFVTIARRISRRRRRKQMMSHVFAHRKFRDATNKMLTLKGMLSEDNKERDIKRKSRFPLGIKNDGFGDAC